MSTKSERWKKRQIQLILVQYIPKFMASRNDGTGLNLF